MKEIVGAFIITISIQEKTYYPKLFVSCG